MDLPTVPTISACRSRKTKGSGPQWYCLSCVEDLFCGNGLLTSASSGSSSSPHYKLGDENHVKEIEAWQKGEPLQALAQRISQQECLGGPTEVKADTKPTSAPHKTLLSSGDRSCQQLTRSVQRGRCSPRGSEAESLQSPGGAVAPKKEDSCGDADWATDGCCEDLNGVATDRPFDQIAPLEPHRSISAVPATRSSRTIEGLKDSPAEDAAANLDNEPKSTRNESADALHATAALLNSLNHPDVYEDDSQTDAISGQRGTCPSQESPCTRTSGRLRARQALKRSPTTSHVRRPKLESHALAPTTGNAATLCLPSPAPATRTQRKRKRKRKVSSLPADFLASPCPSPPGPFFGPLGTSTAPEQPFSHFHALSSYIHPETRISSSPGNPAYPALSAPQLAALETWKAAVDAQIMFGLQHNSAFMQRNGLLFNYPDSVVASALPRRLPEDGAPQTEKEEKHDENSEGQTGEAGVEEGDVRHHGFPTSALEYSAFWRAEDGPARGVMEIGGEIVEIRPGDVKGRLLSEVLREVDGRVKSVLRGMGREWDR